MKTQLIGLAALALMFSSCGGGENKTESNDSKRVKMAEEVCTYSYNNETTVKWTAFKFTERVGVGGTIDSMSVTSPKSVDSPKDILMDTEFQLYTSSVNTKNPERDAKIVSFFFGKMENGEVIRGKVMEVSGGAREGSLSVTLGMNGRRVDQQMKYFVEGKTVTINGTIDLSNFGGQDAVESLNNVCKDLHTGEDGVSKLWPDVDIEIVSVLGQECK